MSELTAQDVANLVINKPVTDAASYGKFTTAVKGRPLDFLVEVFRLIPEPKSESERGPDALQLSALMYVGDLVANLIAEDVLQATPENEHKLAQKCKSIFHLPWTANMFSLRVERRLEEAKNLGVVCYILSLVNSGEWADHLLEFFVSE